MNQNESPASSDVIFLPAHDSSNFGRATCEKHWLERNRKIEDNCFLFLASFQDVIDEILIRLRIVYKFRIITRIVIAVSGVSGFEFDFHYLA